MEANSNGSRFLNLGNLSIDVEGRQVSVQGEPRCLAFQEFQLLLRLARDPERIHSLSEICYSLWGSCGRMETKRLNVIIARLRDKLYGLYPYTIETVRLRGYGFTCKQEGIGGRR